MAFVVGGNDAIQRVWGVVVDDAVPRFASLECVLRLNDRLAARYGGALNALAARTLFAMTAELRGAELRREQRFVPAQDVPRRMLLGWLDEFLDSKQSVMAVVGPSNVGKSWALAAWSLQPGRNSVRVFLEARALDIAPAPLEELVAERLALALRQRFPDRANEGLLPAGAELGRLLTAAGVRLVVILDAINEAPDWERFATAWLPRAVAWTEEHGMRLVISCREESWTTVVGASRLKATQFFVPHSLLHDGVLPEGDGKAVIEGAASACVRLTDFDEQEATQAAIRYGIGPADDAGPHPLMYRIASELHSEDAGESGRLLMLERYIADRLARVGSRIRMTEVRRTLLEDSLRQLADLLPPGGEGGVPLRQALNLVGDLALLEGLVSEGLLSSSGGHVRFRYDQLADSMRTIVPDALRGFSESLRGGTRRDVQDIASATITLLRLESEDREEEYHEGLDLLLAAIAEEGGQRYPNLELMAGAERVARALPKRRVGHILRIHAAIVRHGAGWRGAAACTENARLPAGERAALLLELMVIDQPTGDRSGHPFRWKDWQEEWRRRSFEVEAGHNNNTPLAGLRRLLRRHTDSVFEIVWNGLQDQRRIGNEASLASACAGLLFVESAELLEEIVEHLLTESPPSDSPGEAIAGVCYLGDSLAAHNPRTVARLLLAAWKRGSTSYMLVRMLCGAADSGSEEVWPAIEDLFYRLRDMPKRRASVWALAMQLRRREPEEVDAWDWLSRNWQVYFTSGALPALRASEAIERMAHEGVGFAEFVLSGHIGTRKQQRPFVRGVISALAIEHARGRLGLFLEQHLDNLEEHRELQRPWVALAMAIVEDKACEHRRPLVFRAFASVDVKWAEQVRRKLIDRPGPGEWPETVDSLANWDIADDCWAIWFLRAQRNGADEVDRLAWAAIARNYSTDDRQRNGKRLVNFWRSLAKPSPFAVTICSRLDCGESLQDLLDEFSQD